MSFMIDRQFHFVYMRNIINVVLQCDDLYMSILNDVFIILIKFKKVEQ